MWSTRIRTLWGPHHLLLGLLVCWNSSLVLWTLCAAAGWILTSCMLPEGKESQHLNRPVLCLNENEFITGNNWYHWPIILFFNSSAINCVFDVGTLVWSQFMHLLNLWRFKFQWTWVNGTNHFSHISRKLNSFFFFFFVEECWLHVAPLRFDATTMDYLYVWCSALSQSHRNWTVALWCHEPSRGRAEERAEAQWAKEVYWGLLSMLTHTHTNTHSLLCSSGVFIEFLLCLQEDDFELTDFEDYNDESGDIFIDPVSASGVCVYPTACRVIYSYQVLQTQ